MKQLLWYVGCCWTLSLVSVSAAHASPDLKSSAIATGNAASLGGFSSTDYRATTAIPAVASGILAQTPPAPPAPEVPGSAPAKPATSPSSQETKDLQDRLNNINNSSPSSSLDGYNPKTSPAFSIFNPVGFGADKNLVFFALSYQNRTRYSQTSDGEAGFGIGLGDAVNSVGAELAYSINSFGSTSTFGSGAFNIKVHKRLSEDSSVAIGWNQFAQVNLGPGKTNAAANPNTNNGSDYPRNSYYAVGTKIFRTREDINEPFSRVAVTGGVGSGVFLPFNENNGGNLNPTGLNVFGSVGVRIARPVSAVVEWTGQDLAAGISIAPFENFPLVITPAFRDIAGISNSTLNPNATPAGPRFILGASVAFNF